LRRYNLASVLGVLQNCSASRKIVAMSTEQEAASLAMLKQVPIFSVLSEQEFASLTSHLLQRKYAGCTSNCISSLIL